MLRMQAIPTLTLLIFLCCLSNATFADAPTLSLDGFGTLGVVHSSEEEADFVANLFMPKGAGSTSEWSAEVDSKLGLQLTAILKPDVSSVVQVVSEQRYDGTYKPAIEWANISFDVTPELNLRVGRVMLPIYMSSEYRKVGYAIPWVRPPLEVYRSVPVTNIDGVDASYRFRIGNAINTLRATYGQGDVTAPYIDEAMHRAMAEARSRDGLTLSNIVERGNLRAFAAYSQFRLTIEEFNPLFEVYRRYGPEGGALANRYDIDDKPIEVISLGAQYDPGSWFVMGEWTQFESRTFLADSRGWYLSGGYRIGDVTPYLTYARQRNLSNTSSPGLSQPGSEALDAQLNILLESQPQQESISIGLRWDFNRNLAMKAQFDHIDHGESSPGYLVNLQPGFESGGSFNLFSLALDFVF